MKTFCTRYNLLSLGITLLVFFAWSFFASAQQYEPGSVPPADPVDINVTIYDQEPGSGEIPVPPEDGFRENMPKRTDGPGMRAQNLNEEQRRALSVDRQNRIINLSRNMQAHMQAAIERLEQIAGRLESRMKKMESAGIDTTSAREALRTARETLDTAKATLADIDARVVSSISSDTPRSQFQEIRNVFMGARSTIKDVHTRLVTVFQLLSAAQSAAPSDEATTETTTGTAEEATEMSTSSTEGVQ